MTREECNPALIKHLMQRRREETCLYHLATNAEARKRVQSRLENIQSLIDLWYAKRRHFTRTPFPAHCSVGYDYDSPSDADPGL